MLFYLINSLAGVSTSLVAEDNEINTELVYIFSAIVGVIVVILAILLIAIATIRYSGTKQRQGMKDVGN